MRIGRFLKKAATVAAVGAGVYYAAPFLSSTGGQALVSRFISGGGRAPSQPQPAQLTGGGTYINVAAPGTVGGYGGFEGGGAMSQIYPSGGGVDGAGILSNPVALYLIIGGVFLLVLVTFLRR